MTPDTNADGVDSPHISAGTGSSRAAGTTRRRIFAGPWKALGRFGKIAFLGVVVSLGIAVVLGFAVPAGLERGIINTHLETLTRAVDDLLHRGLLSEAGPLAPDTEALDDAVRDGLIGANVVRVNLWDTSGVILYSDDAGLIGVTLPMSADLRRALEGRAHGGHVGDDVGEASVRALGHVWEFYAPIFSSDGTVIGALEVYERPDEIHGILTSTRNWTWLAIGVALAVLLAFILGLVAANFRAVNRRRLTAEELFADLARAQEEERERIIGSLHDDVGQPLYRVLYGIEGSIAQLEPGHPVREEMSRIAGLVRTIDGTLRSELTMLHQGAIDELGLETLLSHLANDVRSETPLRVSLEVHDHQPLPVGARAALFRAAREGVTNSRKHSGASRVSITVTQGNGRVILDVEDDGSGLRDGPGLGLATTRSRLETIGGGLEVTDKNTSGTLFRAWVPVRGDER